MEKAGLLQEEAGDHIRIIVAEGIAEMAGDRYRSYPSVPRPDKVPIRRDMIPHPCVLATPARPNHVKKKGTEHVGVRKNTSSSTNTSTTTTSRGAAGATRRVSAWAAGVANASSISASPEKSIVFESVLPLDYASMAADQLTVLTRTRLAANASRWDAILDQPIRLTGSAPYSSYTLSGRKTEKRAVSPSPTDDAYTKSPVTTEAATVDATAGIIDVDGNEM